MNKHVKEILKYALWRLTGCGKYVNIKDVREKVDLLLQDGGSVLNKIGFVQGTDKSSIVPVRSNMIEAHDYLRHYESLFVQFREEKFSLIEFGCAGGSSLRTWEKYFPNAEIYGVDLDENAKRHETERIHIVIGDAASKDTYDTLRAAAGQALIIIDDASHAWGDQRRSFELFWDMLSPGGFYAVEDIECGTLGAYPAYPPKVLDAQPFNDYMHDLSKFLRWPSYGEPEKKTYNFSHLPAQIQKIEREMDMCMFIPDAVIVRKKA